MLQFLQFSIFLLCSLSVLFLSIVHVYISPPRIRQLKAIISICERDKEKERSFQMLSHDRHNNVNSNSKFVYDSTQKKVYISRDDDDNDERMRRERERERKKKPLLPSFCSQKKFLKREKESNVCRRNVNFFPQVLKIDFLFIASFIRF